MSQIQKSTKTYDAILCFWAAAYNIPNTIPHKVWVESKG